MLIFPNYEYVFMPFRVHVKVFGDAEFSYDDFEMIGSG